MRVIVDNCSFRGVIIVKTVNDKAIDSRLSKTKAAVAKHFQVEVNAKCA
jgi:hypothetical protein